VCAVEGEAKSVIFALAKKKPRPRREPGRAQPGKRKDRRKNSFKVGAETETRQVRKEGSDSSLQ